MLRWVAAAAFAAGLAAACGAIASAQPGIGINYLWYKLDRESIKQCTADGGPRDNGEWILPSYGDPAVRATVRAQLRAMRQAGFTSMRVLAFFYHSTDAEASDSFTSTDGSIRAADRTKLAQFVTDIAAAGFKRLEVVPSFQAENWLYCRNKTWGDCFAPSRTDENWRFIEQTAKIAIASAGSMNLRFDLGNEAAPDPRMPSAALANAKTYVQTIAARFAHEFQAPWTISTARSDASAAHETTDRLQLLVDDLSEANLKPPFLELHDYSPDGNDVKQSLDEASAIAARIGAHLVLGELRYHSASQAGAIAAWVRAHPNSPLIDAIQWPETDPATVCATLPPPPYSPGPFGATDK